MTPSEVIAEARTILNDEDNVTPRYSDAKLLVYVNDWAKQLARSRPSIFNVTQDLVLAAGVETQEVPRGTTLGLADVLRSASGGRIRKVPREQIEDHLRFSYASGAYEPELWCPVEGDAWRFSVYPKPTTGSSLSLVVKGDSKNLLLTYGTQALQEKQMVLPPLHNVAASISMVANTSEQSLSRTTTFGLVDVVSNASGGRVKRIKRDEIEELIRNGSGSVPVLWCPIDDDPWGIMVWPKPAAVSTLNAVVRGDTKNLLISYGLMAVKESGPPAIFNAPLSLAMVANENEQSVSRTTTFGLVDVVSNAAGDRPLKIERELIEEVIASPSGSNPVVWCPVEGDPFRFRVWPVPTSAATLNITTATQNTTTLAAYSADMRDKGLAPHALFNATASFTMTANTPHQEVSRTTTLGIVDVATNAAGKHVRRVSQEVMDRLLRSSDMTTPALWSPIEGDPWRFLVWPEPATAANLNVIVSGRNDAEMAAYGQAYMKEKSIELPATYHAAQALTLTANSHYQEAPRATTMGVVDVTSNSTGGGVRRVTREYMDEVIRHAAQPGPSVWCPFDNDPWRFLVWPAPSAVVSLNVIQSAREDGIVQALGLAYMKDKGIELPQTYNAAQSFAMTAGSYYQEVNRASTMGVVDVSTNADGKPVRRVSREYIDDMMRNTFPAQNTTPELWAPDEKDPWRFIVYPKPDAGKTIKVVVVSTPVDVALGGSLVPGNEYRASAANYVAARALMANTGTADAPRANGLLQLSAQLAGGATTAGA